MRILALLVGLIVLPLVVAPAFAGLGPPAAELSWGNDQLYQTTVARYFNSGSANARVPYYGISPVDPAHPLDPGGGGVCAHDHVVAVPQGNHGTFSANFEFFLVVPDDKALASGRVDSLPCDLAAFGVTIPLASAADLDNDSTTQLQPLTSVEKVQTAASEGLVTLMDIGVRGVVAVKRAG